MNFIRSLFVNCSGDVSRKRAMIFGLIAAGDFLLQPINKYFHELTWHLMKDHPEICFATLGNDAGLIGAAGCAWEAHRTGEW